MLGDLITRGLILFLGYAYPAFECFKTVEKNRVQIEELRFWCQYWIIVALLTVIERIGDTFVSWVPMYGEMKLALFIYLWYPKTKGSGYLYDTLLRPYVVNHGQDIDQKVQELRVRAWDLAIYYCENCTSLGQSCFFQIVEYLTNQSGKLKRTGSKEKKDDYYQTGPPRLPLARSPSFFQQLMGKKPEQPSDRKRPPMPPPGSGFRSMAQGPKSDLLGQTGFMHAQTHEEFDPDDYNSGSSSSPDGSERGGNRRTNAARHRFGRSK